MADLVTRYTLATGGGTIVFNDGDLHTHDDLYWISNVQGLDGAPIRAPIDSAPQAHGGLVHNFWKGPRHIGFEGALLVQSIRIGGPCQPVLNTMEEALRVALDSILQTDGTLSWTPLGMSARSLSVRNEVPLDITPIENYALRQFTFGLISANPDW